MVRTRAVRVADLDYELPPHLIAQRPPEARDGGRLLVCDEPLVDATILDLVEHVPRGALLVVNDTRVVPARLLGKKRASGGQVELLLLRAMKSGEPDEGTSARYQAFARSSKPLRLGARLDFGGPHGLSARIAAERASGERELEVELTTADGTPVAAAIEDAGHMPLPPYVERADDAHDRERYQTVFATSPGAVAAPTAGLHLSHLLLERLRENDVTTASVTLHVGPGTFAPVITDDLDDHRMHSEELEVGPEAVRAIAEARSRRRPVVAVGTTVVRALESSVDPGRPGCVMERKGETRLLIQPGYDFAIVDLLLTNFHLPRSTLLALVCAFAGRERVMAAYAHAIEASYRFFSYGDAMLLRRAAGGDGSTSRWGVL